MRLVEKVLRWVVVLAVVGAAVFFVGRLVVGFVGGTEPILTINANAPRGGCPGTPNCVSSYAETPEHAIDPIACSAPDDTKVEVFADAIDSLPSVERTSFTSWVVYSRIFRFPDDVRIEPSPRGIEVYSASRLGAGDFGANRERVEQLRELVDDDPRCG